MLCVKQANLNVVITTMVALTKTRKQQQVNDAERALSAKLGKVYKVVDVVNVGRWGVAERTATVVSRNHKKYFFKTFILNSPKFAHAFRKCVKYHNMFAKPEVKILRAWTRGRQGYMLSKFVENTKCPSLSKRAMQRAAIQLVRSLRTMHNAKFVHNDLAPKNILFKPSGDAYLIDFEDTKPATTKDIQQENDQFLALFWEKHPSEEAMAMQSACIQAFQNEPARITRVSPTKPTQEAYMVGGVAVVLARQRRGKNAGRVRVVSVHTKRNTNIAAALDQVLRGVSFGQSAYFKTGNTQPYLHSRHFKVTGNLVEWTAPNMLQSKHVGVG